MAVSVEYRKIKGGKSARLVYTINGRKYHEKLDIRLYNRDPDLKIKKQMVEAIRAKKELEIATQSHNLNIIYQTATLSEYLQSFISASQLNGIKKYKNLKNYVDTFFKGRRIDTINSVECSKFLEYMYSEVSVLTANTYFACLSRIFDEAMGEMYCRINPCKGVKKTTWI